MFSIGLIMYITSIFFHSGEDDLLDLIIELMGALGLLVMGISVAIFAWKVMP